MTSPISKRSRRLYKKDTIILEFKRLIEMLGVLPKKEKSVFQSKVGGKNAEIPTKILVSKDS